MNIAILSVYYVQARTLWVAKMQLDMLQLCSKKYNITLYASITGGREIVEPLLGEYSFVKLIEDHSTDSNPSKQHGDSLKILLNAAKQKEYDYFVTLDMDAFPIKENWLENLSILLNDRQPVAAIDRVENGDSSLTHPSFCVLKKSFVQENNLDFYPNSTHISDLHFQHFLLDTNQRIDTGITIAYQLSKNRLDWVRLQRSNSANIHFLMAGIYGDSIFHMGATSREPKFYYQISNDAIIKRISWLKNLPFLWKLHDIIYDTRVKSISKTNKICMSTISSKLKRDPISFIDTLR